MPDVDLALLLPSWELALRAERKSPQTVKAYGDGVRRFLSWCQVQDRVAVLDRRTVDAFVGDLLDSGAEPSTARARQLAVRRFRPGWWRAGTGALWLGDRGKEFSYDALHKTLGERAAAAGIVGFRPHRLRHTAAHRWLAAGGSEGGLMAVAGWTRPDMLLPYTRAQASERAAQEARTLTLGDW